MAHSQAQAFSPTACLRDGALLLFSYALLLITLGFRLYEDAAIPPWAAFLRYPENFTKDLLAQSFQGVSFSERTIAAHVYAPLIGRWWLVLLLHAGFSLILIAGLYRVARHLIGSSGAAWAAVWLFLPGLYYQNWGSNELYYPSVQPSLLAKSVGVWVWVGLLRGWGSLAAGGATHNGCLSSLGGVAVGSLLRAACSVLITQSGRTLWWGVGARFSPNPFHRALGLAPSGK
jgi:hypothetical protein